MIRDFISKIFQATLLKWGYGFEPQTKLTPNLPPVSSKLPPYFLVTG